MAKGRNKNNRNTQSNARKPKQVDEFDLESSLKRVNQRKNISDTYTSTENNISENRPRPLNSDFLNKEGLEETQLLLDMNNRFSDKFEALRADIHGTEERIALSADKVRVELEGKLEKKVSRELFAGAVSAVVIIAGIVYALSYSHLVTKVDTNIQSAQKNENSIKDVQKNIKTHDESIKVFEKSIYKLEIEKQMSEQAKTEISKKK